MDEDVAGQQTLIKAVEEGQMGLKKSHTHTYKCLQFFYINVPFHYVRFHQEGDTLLGFKCFFILQP